MNWFIAGYFGQLLCVFAPQKVVFGSSAKPETGRVIRGDKTTELEIAAGHERTIY